MTDRPKASAVTATRIDAFMAFITTASVAVFPRYTRPLCLQGAKKVHTGGHRSPDALPSADVLVKRPCPAGQALRRFGGGHPLDKFGAKSVQALRTRTS